MTTSLFFSLPVKKHKQGFSFHVPLVSYHLIQFLTSIVFTLWNKIREEEYNGKSKNNCMEDEKWCIKFKSDCNDGTFANKPRARNHFLMVNCKLSNIEKESSKNVKQRKFMASNLFTVMKAPIKRENPRLMSHNFSPSDIERASTTSSHFPSMIILI